MSENPKEPKTSPSEQSKTVRDKEYGTKSKARDALEKVGAVAFVGLAGVGAFLGAKAAGLYENTPLQEGGIQNAQDCVRDGQTPTDKQIERAINRSDGLIAECPPGKEIDVGGGASRYTGSSERSTVYDAAKDLPTHVHDVKTGERLTVEQAATQRGQELGYLEYTYSTPSPSDIPQSLSSNPNLGAAIKQVNLQIPRHENVKVNTQSTAASKSAVPVGQNPQHQKSGNSRA